MKKLFQSIIFDITLGTILLVNVVKDTFKGRP